MKTAISVDDDLLSQADQLAQKLGLSRSRLVANALEAYLHAQRQAEVLRQLNEVYAEPDPADARIVKKLKAKFASTIRDKW